MAFARIGADRKKIAILTWQRIDIFGRFLEALVFLKAPDQVGARVVLGALQIGRTRQQHA